MTYEYEGRIIGMLGGVEDRHFIDLSDYKEELKEAYAKAKAWDNYITDVRERIKFSESTEEDIEKAMQEVTNNYMEDE